VWAQARAEPSCAASDNDDESGRHTGLGENGPQGGTRDAHVKAVDEEHVKRNIGAETHDGRDQRGSRVLQSAKNSGHSQEDQHRRDADRRHPQVGRCLRQCGRGRAEQGAKRGGIRGDHDPCDDADGDRQPHPIHAGADGAPLRARAHLPGDDRGGSVGEEDEDVGSGDERRTGDTEPGQLRRAQVPDDRRVGQ